MHLISLKDKFHNFFHFLIFPLSLLFLSLSLSLPFSISVSLSNSFYPFLYFSISLDIYSLDFVHNFNLIFANTYITVLVLIKILYSTNIWCKEHYYLESYNKVNVLLCPFPALSSVLLVKPLTPPPFFIL